MGLWGCEVSQPFDPGCWIPHREQRCALIGRAVLERISNGRAIRYPGGRWFSNSEFRISNSGAIP